jgi:hypothetical protein
MREGGNRGLGGYKSAPPERNKLANGHTVASDDE